MILLITTAAPLCQVTLVDGDDRHTYEWQADRQLARGLLGYLRDCLARHDAAFADLRGIGAYRGPGSFTGLRIGLTVANTLADGLHIPIVGTTGGDWQTAALQRLTAGGNDQIVLPEYGADARITQPRK